jgi:hypothetical protein
VGADSKFKADPQQFAASRMMMMMMMMTAD